MSASFKNNASFVSRLPTIRRHKSTSLHSPAPHSKPAVHRYDVNASAENLGECTSARFTTLFPLMLTHTTNTYQIPHECVPIVKMVYRLQFCGHLRYQRNPSYHFTNQATLHIPSVQFCLSIR